MGPYTIMADADGSTDHLAIATSRERLLAGVCIVMHNPARVNDCCRNRLQIGRCITDRAEALQTPTAQIQLD